MSTDLRVRSTENQKSKVRFIEQALNIEFKGFISSNLDCQLFIDEFYEDAMFEYNEAKEAYYGEFDW